MNQSLTLQEILDALQPAWEAANKTDSAGRYIRPDYRKALYDAWLDIVVASEMKQRDAVRPMGSLNVDATRHVSR